MFKSNSALIKHLIPVKDNYYEKAKTAEDKTTVGPPHLVIWGHMNIFLTTEEVGARTQQILKKYSEEECLKDAHIVEDEVRLCDLRECYDGENYKLTINMRGVAVRPSVMRALEESGGTYKPRRAPRNGLERELQSALEELEAEY